MLAAVSYDFSGQFAIVNLEKPTLKDGEALVRVIGSGVCHSDLHVLKDEVKFPRPAVLGHEVLGEVVEISDSERSHLNISVGDIVVSSFIMPCTKCRNCVSGHSNICSLFFTENRLKGNMLDGSKRLFDFNKSEIASYSMAGFAEYSVIPLSALVKLTSNKVNADWCVLGCAGVTAYSSVSRAISLRKSSNVVTKSAAIIGLGGVGLFMTVFCRLLGIEEIVAIDLDPEKLKLASALGADKTINSFNKDFLAIRDELGMTGVDLVFEAVGSSSTLELSVELLKEGGLVTAVGIASHGTRAAIEITPLVRREFTIRGSFGGTVEKDLREVVKLAESGQIPLEKLVTHHYKLHEINLAFQSLADRKTLGRSIIEFER